MIFDTHAHAYWNGLEQRQEEVKTRMDAENVMRSIQVGTDWKSNHKALSLAQKWGTNTWCAAAIHPTTCQDLPVEAASEWTARLKPFIEDNRNKVIAVGETGLDYYHLTKNRRTSQKQTQHAFFKAHADLSVRLDLPLVIHTRNAASDTVALIKGQNVRRAVIHCFSEDTMFARELLSWSEDIYISFSGILTYKQALPIRQAARSLPLDRILVETDTPFLVPETVKDQFELNEPACTRYVMDALKELRSEPDDVVENTVWDNSNRFFRIS
jgi:TatD DNase family protein